MTPSLPRGMDPGVMSHGMKADPPGYLRSKYECFLTSGFRVWTFEKPDGSVTGTRTTRVTTIALLVLRTGQLKMICNIVFFLTCIKQACWSCSLKMLSTFVEKITISRFSFLLTTCLIFHYINDCTLYSRSFVETSFGSFACGPSKA